MDEEEDKLFNAARRDFLRGMGMALPFLGLSCFMPSLALADPDEKPKILMIDPGHGGRDPGAIGLSGTKEKDITLDIARRMVGVINSRSKRVKAQLTRDEDVFIPLAERVKKGRAAKADLFLSVHADSAPNKAAKGLSAYTLSEKASDDFANLLAQKENKADVFGGLPVDVNDKEVAAILFDLTARRTRNTAQRVKVSFIKAMARRWQLLNEPMRSANFAVLRSPDVPSLLIETGFLSNKQDEELLVKPQMRQRIAELMAAEFTFLMRSSLFS
ncbi:MAG: N-acetylmuramoyl-L-alanine amidase [Alphaproteobacteria bacterium]|nr:N-acetylmuramoyl-L-alanine amidase [Alphaproteobacteria bacterium]